MAPPTPAPARQVATDHAPAATEWNAEVAWQRWSRYRPLAWLALLLTVGAMAVRWRLGIVPDLVAIPALMYVLRELYFGRPHEPRMSRRHPAHVSVDGYGLRIAGPALTKRWPRHEVRSGWVVSFGGLHSAVIDLVYGDRLWVNMPSAAEARTLLRSLDLAEDQRAFVAPLVRKGGIAEGILLILLATALRFGAHFAGMQQLPTLPLTILATLVLVLGAMQLVGVVPPRAVVGTDGVRILSGRRKRFVSYAQVTAVDCTPEGVWLRRPQGDVLLRTSHPRMVPSSPSRHTLALYHRVREARALGMGGNVASAKLELLERKGRGVGEWLERLRALSQQGGYRELGLGSDDLLRVLVDVKSSTETRLAAAAALTARDEPGMRERVRIAGASSANPRLRVAIDAVTEERLDEAAISEALALEERPRHRGQSAREPGAGGG